MSLTALLGLLFVLQPVPDSPELFFLGETRGEGTVRVLLSGSHRFRVESRGHLEGDGALILEQTIAEEGKRVRTRRWRLLRTGLDRLSGTMTEARGPVSGEIQARVLRIRYRDRDGMSVDQRISVEPNGRTAHNRMRVRRFGITVARVDEIIRRAD